MTDDSYKVTTRKIEGGSLTCFVFAKSLGEALDHEIEFSFQYGRDVKTAIIEITRTNS